MSTKKQLSQKDNLFKEIIINDSFIHHAFCVEGSRSSDEYKKDILEILDNNTKIFDIDESVFTIDQARFISKLAIKKYTANSKIVILVSANTYTEESQNALLKTLEEPKDFVTIILVSPRKDNFLKTILSRSMIIRDINISNKVNDLVKRFNQMDLKERYEYCEEIANLHERGELSRSEIVSFMDLYVKEYLEKSSSKDRLFITQSFEKIYNLLSRPTCSVKQACEAYVSIFN